RECRMRGKGPACETRASKTRTADAAKVRARAHAAEMRTAAHRVHPSAHSAMHPHPSTTKAGGMAATKATTATKAPASTAAATTAAPHSRERRWRKSERRTNRARNETTEKPAVHVNFSIVQNCCDRLSSQPVNTKEAQLVQRLQMTNVPVSDTEFSFRALA